MKHICFVHHTDDVVTRDKHGQRKHTELFGIRNRATRRRLAVFQEGIRQLPRYRARPGADVHIHRRGQCVHRHGWHQDHPLLGHDIASDDLQRLLRHRRPTSVRAGGLVQPTSKRGTRGRARATRPSAQPRNPWPARNVFAIILGNHSAAFRAPATAPQSISEAFLMEDVSTAKDTDQEGTACAGQPWVVLIHDVKANWAVHRN